MRYLKLWLALAFVMVGSFAVLGYYGLQIYREAPPIPERVVTADGKTLFTGQDILDGMNVWQSMGGQQVGSIWGHGAYVAPDWNADWLHRESVWLLDRWAMRDHGQPFAEVGVGEQAVLRSAAAGDAHEHLRPGSGRAGALGGSCRGIRGAARLLRRPLWRW